MKTYKVKDACGNIYIIKASHERDAIKKFREINESKYIGTDGTVDFYEYQNGYYVNGKKIADKKVADEDESGFTIDTESDERYYIIKKDGKEFAKVNKSNDLATIKKHFGITDADVTDSNVKDSIFEIPTDNSNFEEDKRQLVRYGLTFIKREGDDMIVSGSKSDMRKYLFNYVGGIELVPEMIIKDSVASSDIYGRLDTIVGLLAKTGLAIQDIVFNSTSSEVSKLKDYRKKISTITNEISKIRDEIETVIEKVENK